jgi:hypothetical protein
MANRDSQSFLKHTERLLSWSSTQTDEANVQRQV